VAVDIQRGSDAGMPEHGLNGLGRFAQFQHEGGEGMLRIVEAVMGEPGLLYQSDEAPINPTVLSECHWPNRRPGLDPRTPDP
jgi:hypothetical protein